MYNILLIHYNEIALKGGNRKYFENKLLENIKTLLTAKEEIQKIYKQRGKIICELAEKTNLENIKQLLINLPGIAYFGIGEKTKLDLEDIKNKTKEIAKTQQFNSFKIKTQRTNKQFQYTSPQINEIIGKEIKETLNKKVDLENPELTIFIEIDNDSSIIYLQKIKGAGGLPTGVSGKIICSLSGGIDSPVAGYTLMKRGCEITFVHIFNDGLTSQASLEKILNIVKQLTKYQLKSKLYIVPFSKIQNEIIKNVPEEYRMIIYRRYMLKIIENIAQKENINFIVTGDSIGQVASQTIDNLQCIYEATTLNIFTPLSGLNKEEITEIAQKIDTYKYSILPYLDCCSLMIPKHPETKGNLQEIKKLEENIKNEQNLIEYCVSQAEIINYNYLEKEI
ncbi:MAG TPA: tRNA uracil 4-sulfurtransferase ThiI [archaeon]|jgi:thiamine biosynthesis protein ThiI|nr:tRNA uracil 4-sulfurtransferase ThiI [archaeon]